jgi:CheY-like chemotaxis protein
MTNTPKALIVDDSRAACAVLARLLKSFGIDSDSVNSAADAFEYLESQTPAVIFMDHSMPDMDGLEAVALIQRHKVWASIPVFMFTARSDAEFLQQVERSAARGIIPKSLEQDVILAALQQIDLLSSDRSVSTLAANDEAEQAEKQPIPSQEQRFQVWLESFIENKITPALAYRLDHSTRELREEILQNGDKLHRSSLQFHMQQQKQLVRQIEAERESLIAAYEWNQQRFLRRLTGVLGGVVVILLSVIGFIQIQEQKSQQALSIKMAQLQETQVRLSEVLADLSAQLVEAKSLNHPPRPVLLDPDGEQVAELVSYNDNYSLLKARSMTGYFFTLENMQVEPLASKIYFLAQNCFGTRWVESTPGVIYSDHQGQLWYTPKDIKPELKVYFSVLNNQGDCESLEGEAELVQLLPNEPELTHLGDGPLRLSQLQ